jgi:excisionase family DNA binding protein
MTLDEALAVAVERAQAPLVERLAAVEAELAGLRRESPPRLLSVADAATALGVSPWTIRRYVAKGKIPSRHIGTRVLCDLSGMRPKTQEEIAVLSRKAGRS